MAEREHLLDSKQMASFVARGFLRFDALVPAEINRAFLEEVDDDRLPVVPAGTPLDQAYPEGSAVRALVGLPAVCGIIHSLVGPGCIFDHHFLHRAVPRSRLEERGLRAASQHTHQDSTIDPRPCFDLQLMYFPHEVEAGMGGTRFVPGSHFRKVSESAIARYQNIVGQQHVVCPAGTLLAMHHGVWHGGGLNASEQVRYMFKIRLQPAVRQRRLWITDDLDEDHYRQRPIFFLRERPDPDHIHSILCRGEKWFEFDTARLEYMNHIRLWRYLLGDDEFDADYWLTRVENVPETSAPD